MKRILVMLLLPLFLTTLLLGCGIINNNLSPVEEPQETAASLQTQQDFLLKLMEKDENAAAIHDLMLKLEQAVLADDFDAAYALVKNATSESKFQKTYNLLLPYYQQEGVLSITRYEKSFSGEEEELSLTYLLTAGEQRLQLVLTATSTNDATATLSALQSEELPTLAELEMKPHRQNFHLVVFLLSLAFVVGVLVDCIRQRVKVKWLWIILIVLGCLQLSFVAEAGSFNIGFNLRLLLTPGQTVRNAIGHSTTLLNLPAGAIAYLIFRNKLLLPPPRPAQGQTPGMSTDASMKSAPAEDMPLDSP